MNKKLFFGFVCVVFLFAIGCKQEGVSLVNSALRDVPSDKKGAFKWLKGINRGQVVKIMEEQKDGDWVKVRLPDGESEGWVMKSYVFKGKKRVIEFTASDKLYDQPDLDSKIIANIPAGGKALILKEKDRWSNINLAWGVDGWVKNGKFKEGSDIISKPRSEVVINGIGTCFVEASSSVAESAGYTYTAMNLFDGNPGTTWQVGNGGAGEWIEITFPEPTTFSAAIINGFVRVDKKFAEYGDDGDLYVLNNRVKSMKVEYWNAQDQKNVSSVSFDDDNRNYQDAGVYQKVTKLRFIIGGVYKGSKWNDTAIAELKIVRQ